MTGRIVENTGLLCRIRPKGYKTQQAGSDNTGIEHTRI